MNNKELKAKTEAQQSKNAELLPSAPLVANPMLATVLSQIDKWIEISDQQAEAFSSIGMPTLSASSTAMSQAYWNVRQLIIVNCG